MILLAPRGCEQRQQILTPVSRDVALANRQSLSSVAALRMGRVQRRLAVGVVGPLQKIDDP
jgi:hypothetical protein